MVHCQREGSCWTNAYRASNQPDKKYLTTMGRREIEYTLLKDVQRQRCVGSKDRQAEVFLQGASDPCVPALQEEGRALGLYCDRKVGT